MNYWLFKWLKSLLKLTESLVVLFKSFKQQSFNRNWKNLIWKWDTVKIIENWKDRLIWELKVVDYTFAKLNNTLTTEIKGYTTSDN
jgi:hypothetical protein